MEIIFFTYGDANRVSTWSNVPFCFSRALMDKGCTVHLVDIRCSMKYRKTFYYLIERPLSLLFPNHEYDAFRSNIFYYYTYLKIHRAIRQHPNADWCFFLCFDFYNKFSQIPSLVFGDWTFQIQIEERLQRKPYFFEKWFIKKQNKVITHADKVVCLFPETAERIRVSFPGTEAHYLGQNVINTVYKGNLCENEIINRKAASNKVLFIGRRHYLKGARLLKSAISRVRSLIPDVSVHYIGLTADQLCVSESEAEFVHCYGVLNKASSEECSLYYNLILNSKLFCNPSSVWAGYSSTIESMYYYTPIVSPCIKDFKDEFGSKLSFGVYDAELTEESLSNAIISVLTAPDYKSIALNAHNAVKDYTWSNYVDKILNLIIL